MSGGNGNVVALEHFFILFLLTESEGCCCNPRMQWRCPEATKSHTSNTDFGPSHLSITIDVSSTVINSLRESLTTELGCSEISLLVKGRPFTNLRRT